MVDPGHPRPQSTVDFKTTALSTPRPSSASKTGLNSRVFSNVCAPPAMCPLKCPHPPTHEQDNRTPAEPTYATLPRRD